MKYYMAKKSVFDEGTLVMRLPPSIRTELVMAAYHVDIAKLNFFKGEDVGYVCSLMMAMKPLTCLPDEVLLEQGDIVEEVIFLVRGTVRIVVREVEVDEAANDLAEEMGDDEPYPAGSPGLIGIIGEGGYFGDIGLTAKTPRLGSFEAVNICQMLSISRQDLESANHTFVLSGQRFVRESESRLKVFRGAKKSAIMLTPTGNITYSKIFADGYPVDACAILTSIDAAFGGNGTSSARKMMSTASMVLSQQMHDAATAAADAVAPSVTGNSSPRNSSSPRSSQSARNSKSGSHNLKRLGSAPTLNFRDVAKHSGERLTPNTKPVKTRRESHWASAGEPLGDSAVSVFRESAEPLSTIEEADETAMDLLKRGVISPYLPWKLRWDMFIGALIVFSVIVVPYRLGFDVPPSHSADIQDLVVDMFFWLDLTLAFRSAFVDSENDILVTVPSEIAKKYFKTWFFVDFFSVFPVAELVELTITRKLPCFYLCTPSAAELEAKESSGDGDGSGLGTLKLLKVVRLVRLMKLIRLMKLGSALEKIEEAFNINPAAFELFKLMLVVTFIAHMFGCFFFFMSVQTTAVEDSWYANIQDSNGITERYIASLYWAFTTMTTVGYGDIVPVSVAEKWYTVVIMMLGATVFGYILANIATLMGQLNARESKVNANLSAIDEFLSEKNIGKVLQKNIKTHTRFALSCSSVFDEYSILQKLPTTLGRKLFYHNHRETLRNICVFNHIKQTGVTMYVFSMLQPAQYADGHAIFKEDAIPNDIYFIYGGKAEIRRKVKGRREGSPEGHSGGERGKINLSPPTKMSPGMEPEGKTIKCADVRPGEIVGYMGLLAHSTHAHSCVARGGLSVYFLNVHDLQNTIYEHPFVALQLQEALGKSIHEQNETFKQAAAKEKRKKIAEIAMMESNVMAGGGDGEAARLAAEAANSNLRTFNYPSAQDLAGSGLVTPVNNEMKSQSMFGGRGNARVTPVAEESSTKGVSSGEKEGRGGGVWGGGGGGAGEGGGEGKKEGEGREGEEEGRKATSTPTPPSDFKTIQQPLTTSENGDVSPVAGGDAEEDGGALPLMRPEVKRKEAPSLLLISSSDLSLHSSGNTASPWKSGGV